MNSPNRVEKRALEVLADAGVSAPPVPVDAIAFSLDADIQYEAFDGDVSSFVPPGNHLVTVRVFDQAGNFAVRSVELSNLK